MRKILYLSLVLALSSCTVGQGQFGYLEPSTDTQVPTEKRTVEVCRPILIYLLDAGLRDLAAMTQKRSWENLSLQMTSTFLGCVVITQKEAAK